ncbi:hypothetical protein LTR37_016292 [Vermiconidia calcicola]|uniref:Uncharacterized protein n=1 Tax=Vermiconidia calcicola TaxID=1690605 RepID=A0ACC3MNB3_9PEZI|nr:hypothetical protein LTR37_016292 [Vermiconidia calcicola]
MTKSPMQILKSGDAALSRCQRALGITERPDTTEDKRALRLLGHSSSGKGQETSMDLYQLQKHHDIRRSSPYPFEGDLYFISVAARTIRNEKGEPTEMRFDSATLDTRDLNRLALGQDGENYVQEIKKESFGRGGACPARPMDDKAKKRIREEFEQRFGGNHDIKYQHDGIKKFDGRKRNVVLVCHDLPKLRQDLSVFGFDPTTQNNVLDAINIANLSLAFDARLTWNCLHGFTFGKIDQPVSLCSQKPSLLKIARETNGLQGPRSSFEDTLIPVYANLHAIVKYAVRSPPLGSHGGSLRNQIRGIGRFRGEAARTQERQHNITSARVSDAETAELQIPSQGRLPSNRSTHPTTSPTFEEQQDLTSRARETFSTASTFAAGAKVAAYVSRVLGGGHNCVDGDVKATTTHARSSSAEEKPAQDDVASDMDYIWSMEGEIIPVITVTISIDDAQTQITPDGHDSTSSADTKTPASAIVDAASQQPRPRPQSVSGGATGVTKTGSFPMMPSEVLDSLNEDSTAASSEAVETLASVNPTRKAADESPANASTSNASMQMGAHVAATAPISQPELPPPMPEGVGDALGRYKRAGEDFSRMLYHAAEPHCNIQAYAKRCCETRVDQYGISHENIYYRIKSENYLKLADIIVDNAKDTITDEMMESLLTERAWREFVDRWYVSLPMNDLRRKEIKGHRMFRVTLEETSDRLIAARDDKETIMRDLSNIKKEVMEAHKRAGF